jgi:RNA polymerase sigma-70 factor (ECF subfamily)
MNEPAAQDARFERYVLPHLDAAYNLARWITRDDHDARDVVQEAYVRALRFFDDLREDGSPRAWLLRIVRNTAYTWRRRCHLHNGDAVDIEHELSGVTDDGDCDPARLVERRESSQSLNDAIAQLPAELRETLVLREIEELSYKEIAQVQQIPMGTVMSRLSRARERLAEILTPVISHEET